MRAFLLSLWVLVVLDTADVSAQQPNSAAASATWGGVNGAPFPIVVNHSGLSVDFVVSGGSNQPYLVGRAPIFVGGTTLPSGIVDIDLNQLEIVLDGFAPVTVLDLFATTGPVGSATWTLPVTQALSLGGFQAAVGDPTSFAGVTLSAASQVTLAPAQSFSIPHGDETEFSILLAYGTTEFYDQTYATIYTNSNGHVNFSPSAGATFNVNQAGFDSGAPCMAGFWCDLDLSMGGASTFYEDVAGWSVSFAGAPEWGVPGSGNDFTIAYDYATGTVSYTYPNGLQTVGITNSPVIVGVTPGLGSASSATNVDYTNGTCGVSSALSSTPFESWNNDPAVQANPFPTLGGCTVSFVPFGFGGPGSGVAHYYDLFM